MNIFIIDKQELVYLNHLCRHLYELYLTFETSDLNRSDKNAC